MEKERRDAFERMMCQSEIAACLKARLRLRILFRAAMASRDGFSGRRMSSLLLEEAVDELDEDGLDFLRRPVLITMARWRVSMGWVQS